MGKLHHWFSKAEPEEKGSFCNEEQEHVDNMSAFDAEVMDRTAQADGAETIWWDGDDEVDTRYNHQIMEKDNDLVVDDDFQPAKHCPGR